MWIKNIKKRFNDWVDWIRAIYLIFTFLIGVFVGLLRKCKRSLFGRNNKIDV